MVCGSVRRTLVLYSIIPSFLPALSQTITGMFCDGTEKTIQKQPIHELSMLHTNGLPLQLPSTSCYSYGESRILFLISYNSQEPQIVVAVLWAPKGSVNFYLSNSCCCTAWQIEECFKGSVQKVYTKERPLKIQLDMFRPVETQPIFVSILWYHNSWTYLKLL